MKWRALARGVAGTDAILREQQEREHAAVVAERDRLAKRVRWLRACLRTSRNRRADVNDELARTRVALHNLMCASTLFLADARRHEGEILVSESVLAEIALARTGAIFSVVRGDNRPERCHNGCTRHKDHYFLIEVEVGPLDEPVRPVEGTPLMELATMIADLVMPMRRDISVSASVVSGEALGHIDVEPVRGIPGTDSYRPDLDKRST